MKNLAKWQTVTKLYMLVVSAVATAVGLLAVVGSLISLVGGTDTENGWAAIGYVLILALGCLVLGYALLSWLSYLFKRLVGWRPYRIFPILGTVLDTALIVSHIALFVSACRTLGESTAPDPTAVGLLVLALLLSVLSFGVIVSDILSVFSKPEKPLC